MLDAWNEWKVCKRCRWRRIPVQSIWWERGSSKTPSDALILDSSCLQSGPPTPREETENSVYFRRKLFKCSCRSWTTGPTGSVQFNAGEAEWSGFKSKSTSRKTLWIMIVSETLVWFENWIFISRSLSAFLQLPSLICFHSNTRSCRGAWGCFLSIKLSLCLCAQVFEKNTLQRNLQETRAEERDRHNRRSFYSSGVSAVAPVFWHLLYISRTNNKHRFMTFIYLSTLAKGVSSQKSKVTCIFRYSTEEVLLIWKHKGLTL